MPALMPSELCAPDPYTIPDHLRQYPHVPAVAEDQFLLLHAVLTGLEPAILSLTGTRGLQLPYKTKLLHMLPGFTDPDIPDRYP
jgi:hypothetical protein